MKTLVVDDELVSRKKMQRIMDTLGECEAAENGEVALKIAMSENPPDIILLDIIMPGMDGYEACRRLKADKRTSKIPVIFISAQSKQEDETKGLGLGAVDYITKPFSPAIVRARVQIHLELKKHRDHLEELVKERTAELTKANAELRREIEERKRAEEEQKRLETQLQRAQKMEAIGTLAGGVAHDLNNILGGVINYPELLLMEMPEESPLRKPILTIQKSGEKAAAIVQDLLTLARRGVAVSEVVDLNHIVSEYLISLEYEKLKEFHPNVKLETDFKEDLSNILGSPVHLSTSIMNLVSNAAEAMPEGGKIFISTQNRYIDQPLRGYDDVTEGDYVTLTVSDTGAGISPEDIEKIFEPFYTKKKMGRSGTGLGMAVVWGTVKDHKGYIDVQSTEGKARPPRLSARDLPAMRVRKARRAGGGQGTTFTLYFPVTRKELTKDRSLVSIQDYMGKGESIQG